MLIISCGPAVTDSTVPTKEQTLEYERLKYVCEDEEGETLQCNFDSDCCEDFSCIPDRSQGRNVKHCLYDPKEEE